MDVPWSLGAVAAAVSVSGGDLELLYDPDQNGSDFDDTTDVETEGDLAAYQEGAATMIGIRRGATGSVFHAVADMGANADQGCGRGTKNSRAIPSGSLKLRTCP